MADYRSKSYSAGKMQIESYQALPSNTKPTNFRSYSTSFTSSRSVAPPEKQVAPPQKLKKGRSTNGSLSKSWSLKDPEVQRKRRVAGYRVYSVEGKLKGSVKKSVRWFKDRYTQVVHGWW